MYAFAGRVVVRRSNSPLIALILVQRFVAPKAFTFPVVGRIQPAKFCVERHSALRVHLLSEHGEIYRLM